MMNVVIPMSGKGSRFLNVGYKLPKPLINVDEKSIIEHLLSKIPQEWNVLFIYNEDHEPDFKISNFLKKIRPTCKLLSIPSNSLGPTWVVKQAIERVPDFFKDENFLVSYCDYSFSWDPYRFESYVKKQAVDCCVISYSGFHPEYIRPTMYAYCNVENGKIVEIREKACFTEDRRKEYASCGAYYFRTVDDMLRSFDKVNNTKSLQLNGEGYVSVACQVLVEEGLDVRVFEIPYFLQFGTPDDLKDYQYWNNVFCSSENLETVNTKVLSVDNILMPMAGQGSRFKNLGKKPFISVDGMPMYRRALNSFPARGNVSLVTLSSDKDAISSSSLNIIDIPNVLPGQALSTLEGLRKLPEESSVLITSCDHGLNFKIGEVNTLIENGADVIVFGVRNYSMASVTPEAFAYIEVSSENDVSGVSVKRPISDTPREDLLLVGTFYFKNVGLLISMIEEHIENGQRVNGELYLDSVVNIAVEKRMIVKSFEVEAYLCWGTPESLNEYNYWKSYFSGLERIPYLE